MHLYCQLGVGSVLIFARSKCLFVGTAIASCTARQRSGALLLPTFTRKRARPRVSQLLGATCGENGAAAREKQGAGELGEKVKLARGCCPTGGHIYTARGYGGGKVRAGEGSGLGYVPRARSGLRRAFTLEPVENVRAGWSFPPVDSTASLRTIATTQRRSDWNPSKTFGAGGVFRHLAPLPLCVSWGK